MSWAVLRAGLVEVLEGVPGIVTVDTSVPPAVDAWPYAYVIYRDGAHTQQGGLIINTYHATIRVVLPWQDPRSAEDLLAPFVDSIPDAIDGQRGLYGRLMNGHVQIVPGSSGLSTSFVAIGDAQWLALDVQVELIEKKPRVDN
jgi:hypothetical protein